MPIRIDEFESAEGADRTPTNAERVIRFLLGNRDRAFKAREIAERTEVAANSIHPVLHRLAERGLVRHKEPYWAIGDPETVLEAAEYHEVARFLDDEIGMEQRSEWLGALDEPTDG